METLIATEGFVYALKTDNSIHGKIITLGKEDSPDNWEEIITPEVWDYNTTIKVKMNSDRFVAMVSEVNSILPDTSRNVSTFGMTEFYLDEIKEEFRTLIMYFDNNAKITTR